MSHIGGGEVITVAAIHCSAPASLLVVADGRRGVNAGPSPKCNLISWCPDLEGVFRSTGAGWNPRTPEICAVGTHAPQKSTRTSARRRISRPVPSFLHHFLSILAD